MNNFTKFLILACLSFILVAASLIYLIVISESKNQKGKSLESTQSHEEYSDEDNSPSVISPELKSPRIFCIMLTHEKNFKTKADFMKNAWAKCCDNFKLVLLFNNDTRGIAEIDHVLQPPGLLVDAYNKLTDKVFYTLKYVYSVYSDYDWYLKADDDTFVFVDNLKWFLSQKNASKPITFGYEFKPFVTGGYHSGGGGYVMSREAVSRLVNSLNKNYSFCENTGTEDIDVNKCLRKLGVRIENSTDEFGRERFHPLSYRSHFKGELSDWLYSFAKNYPQKGFNCCSETTVTFHYVTIEDGIKLLRAQNFTNNQTTCSKGTTNVHEIFKRLDL